MDRIAPMVSVRHRSAASGSSLVSQKHFPRQLADEALYFEAEQRDVDCTAFGK